MNKMMNKIEEERVEIEEEQVMKEDEMISGSWDYPIGLGTVVYMKPLHPKVHFLQELRDSNRNRIQFQSEEEEEEVVKAEENSSAEEAEMGSGLTLASSETIAEMDKMSVKKMKHNSKTEVLSFVPTVVQARAAHSKSRSKKFKSSVADELSLNQESDSESYVSDHHERKRKKARFKKLKCAYVILLMAIFWTFQILPLPVTAFLPIVLLPLLGVQDTSKVSYSYMGESNMMFISAMVLALAAHRAGITRRIALTFTNIFGTSQYMLVIGVGLMTFMVSIGWTNPGAALLMLHIVDTLTILLRQGRRMYVGSNISMISVITTNTNDHLEKEIPSPIEMNGSKLNDVGSLDSLDDVTEEDGESKLRQKLLLTVLFASNLGSTLLPYGSSPSHSLYAYTQSIVKKNETGLLEYNYTDYGIWLWVIAPPLIVTFFLGLGVLALDGSCSFSLRPKRAGVFELGGGGGDLHGYLHESYTQLGPLNWHEFAVLILWFLCGVLWLFKDPGVWMVGWGDFFGGVVGNSTSGMLVVFLLFVIPTVSDTGVLEPLLGWKYVEGGLPWGVVLIVGGGKAVADAAIHSGLVAWISREFVFLDDMLGGGGGSLIVALLIIAFFSEIVGGTTSAPVLLPALINKGSVALLLNCQCSWVFASPIGTPASALLLLAKDGLRGPKTGLILTPISILTLLIANFIIPQPLIV